jgi:hypothetical protein
MSAGVSVVHKLRCCQKEDCIFGVSQWGRNDSDDVVYMSVPWTTTNLLHSLPNRTRTANNRGWQPFHYDMILA